MRVAISNIAWDTKDDTEVAALLNRYDIDAIDIAPGKYFPEPKRATEADINEVREVWQARGVSITGMQALLFGTSGLNVFGAKESQQAMLDHLDAVCRIAAGLGATRLVFGSPKNRDRSALSDAEVEAVAVPFFRHLGDVAGQHGVLICLEPNPTCYGANFMIDSTETASVVEAVDHAAIRMQLDTGALAINGEDPYAVISRFSPLIGHVHASEPNLITLGEGSSRHRDVASAMRQYLPEHVVSIEMLPAKEEPNLASIERALALATHVYRGNRGEMA
ncbi:sugar phosphate isomerase/epimerase [Pseudomonas duriflava]|uniref:Sugar phosphate isomerase/epimerase n=1 Tax=Pseudomonas duriflava TaxID=459528 RepID=A0A562Q9W5_9PSED|nr:TIM barrel protein [Pseudomonas duriflava]TWI53552.1 sugar phosphate isomerase/epimerase [Pseudomonas duriflava]